MERSVFDHVGFQARVGAGVIGKSCFMLLTALVLSAVPGPVAANEIGPADIPKDAPRFEDYPAKPFDGPNAAPDVRSHERSRTYRTLLKGWATEKANFAGHCILATWGCGTGCTQIAVIDARSGKIFHPHGVRTNYAPEMHADLMDDSIPSPRRADFGALHYRPTSRLLVLFGTPEGKAEDHGISYYVWENERMRRIRFVPKAKAPS